MRIPMEALLDLMEFRRPEIRLKKRDQWIKGISLLPRNIEQLDGELLYFCVEPGRVPPAGTAPYVAVAPGPEGTAEGENCILLPWGSDITEAFNDALSFQNHLHDWLQEVEISVGKNEGVQRILDLSTKLLGNPILVITPAFRVVAATWELETSDRVFSEYYELGYLTRDTWNLLRDNGYFNNDYYTGKTVVMPPSGIKSYTSTLTAVVHNGEVGFLILMLCSNFAYSRGVAQIYGYIQDRLLYYLQPLVNQNSFHRSEFDYLVIDILESKITKPEELRERSGVFGRAYNDPYHTVLLRPAQSTDMGLAHQMQALQLEFPDIYTLRYGETILMHFMRRRGDSEHWAEEMEALHRLLERLDAHAGVSEPLVGLESIREGYRQAKFALDSGLRMRGRKQCSQYLSSELSQPKLFGFSEYHVFSMLSGRERETPILSRIRRHDEEHGTDYHRILFVFLSCERNFTQAAGILHMHRNNVIYHIRRMSETFSLDLDRPDLRLQLLMMYKLEDMVDTNP